MAPTDKRCEWRASFAPAQDGVGVVQHTCSEPVETRMPNGKVYCTRHAMVWAESVRVLLGAS